MLGVILAALVVGVGLTVVRALGIDKALAPAAGLASIVVAASWLAALHVPLLLVGVAMIGVAAAGVRGVRGERLSWTIGALGIAVAVPTVLLLAAFASMDVPVSTHDGAFHVETVDALRHGQLLQSWYPTGFHVTVATLLSLTSWIDSARGTPEAAQALILLAPLSLYGLGRALNMRPLIAAIGGLVLALTFIYPYDNQLWGGWPLGTSLLLLMGLFAACARWIYRPSLALAILAAALAGAIVLTHGTEIYSAVVGLAVIVLVRWRRLRWRALARHGPVAAAVAGVACAPYALGLMGWVSQGGATAVGAETLESVRTGMTSPGEAWPEYVLSNFGAASLLDFPVRAVFLAVGAGTRHMRTVLVAWLTFSAIVLGAGLLDVPPMNWLYVVTFPWLVEHRPPQVAVIFASLLVAAGIARAWGWLLRLRPRLARRPHTWRRLAIGGAIVVAFFAEGSAVSVYKTLSLVIGDWNSYTLDDRAAMAWLRANATPEHVLANNRAQDAGIWAPFKADVAVLLPRTAAGPSVPMRELVATHITDLPSAPALVAEACQLHVDYVYQGARELPWDPPLWPDRATLEQAHDLEEVFRSGDAAVFRLRLPC